ncbi:MAG: hypothetical protein GX572_06460, partial [Clostridia bacterium]|nr:hypothetical protein [Clostridia bacterium]
MHKAVKYLGVLLMAGVVALAPTSVMAGSIDEAGCDGSAQDSLSMEQNTAEAAAPDNLAVIPAADENKGDIADKAASGKPDSAEATTTAKPESITYKKAPASNNSCVTVDLNCGNTADKAAANKNCGNIAADKAAADKNCGNIAADKAAANKNCGNTADKAAANKNCGNIAADNNCTKTNGDCGQASCGATQAGATADNAVCSGNCAQFVNAEQLYSLIFAVLTNAGNTCAAPNSDLL